MRRSSSQASKQGQARSGIYINYNDIGRDARVAEYPAAIDRVCQIHG
jgi:hypothetical protein